ncbi:hypothetical protein NAL32_04605 [Chryseobacterium sp. Ch-15]|uniref:DUF1835 domain-containing protein n=1 Tax=Chryseobacterium muglaense TaxID=2893752 RepID=A0A9Q3URN2_9FLAO|nr:hypothetical protein [Chryseobacterium muglaense]MBD3904021.1 hypothetical protein [Chryseobacterium muglaense]MCC9032793.1 hypothetical protein [Chryseobacterium muglaense]MCM2553670.1 hypothetical protein [Chryseobacterium muglaense]
MTNFHILNGDCLAEKFPKNLEGESIIWREALIHGPVSGNNFFENRKRFITENYDSESNYDGLVVKEFQKMQNLPENSEVFFWFEDDLFCQVNFWFLISNLNLDKTKFFRVFPKDTEKGFAESNENDLLEMFDSAKEINDTERKFISNLWKGFQQNNLLKQTSSEIVRNLEELIVANENRFNGTLENQIKDIQKTAESFDEIFKIFNRKYPVYGFGDLQLKRLMNQFF